MLAKVFNGTSRPTGLTSGNERGLESICELGAQTKGPRRWDQLWYTVRWYYHEAWRKGWAGWCASAGLRAQSAPSLPQSLCSPCLQTHNTHAVYSNVHLNMRYYNFTISHWLINDSMLASSGYLDMHDGWSVLEPGFLASCNFCYC